MKRLECMLNLDALPVISLTSGEECKRGDKYNTIRQDVDVFCRIIYSTSYVIYRQGWIQKGCNVGVTLPPPPEAECYGSYLSTPFPGWISREGKGGGKTAVMFTSWLYKSRESCQTPSQSARKLIAHWSSSRRSHWSGSKLRAYCACAAHPKWGAAPPSWTCSCILTQLHCGTNGKVKDGWHSVRYVATVERRTNLTLYMHDLSSSFVNPVDFGGTKRQFIKSGTWSRTGVTFNMVWLCAKITDITFLKSGPIPTNHEPFVKPVIGVIDPPSTIRRKIMLSSSLLNYQDDKNQNWVQMGTVTCRMFLLQDIVLNCLQLVLHDFKYFEFCFMQNVYERVIFHFETKWKMGNSLCFQCIGSCTQ